MRHWRTHHALLLYFVSNQLVTKPTERVKALKYMNELCVINSDHCQRVSLCMIIIEYFLYLPLEAAMRMVVLGQPP